MARRPKQRRTDQSKIDATPPWETRVRAEPAHTTGPFDERDAPQDDGVARVDLGALLVPVGPGMEVRLEMNEAQQVVAATLAAPTGTLQLGVFAAPRNEGIWDDVRAELAASLGAQRGGVSERADGPFGAELSGTLTDEKGGRVPVRFIGVDGPRWFLRGMFAGPVATDRTAAAPFERVLRNVVVVRGSAPIPSRDAVPLRLPKEMLANAAEAGPEPG